MDNLDAVLTLLQKDVLAIELNNVFLYERFDGLFVICRTIHVKGRTEEEQIHQENAINEDKTELRSYIGFRNAF